MLPFADFIDRLIPFLSNSAAANIIHTWYNYPFLSIPLPWRRLAIVLFPIVILLWLLLIIINAIIVCTLFLLWLIYTPVIALNKWWKSRWYEDNVID